MTECPRCRNGRMTEGFVLDRGHGSMKKIQEWVEGEPVKSFWLGVKTSGREALEITTYRCDRCGYLESYAQNPTK